VLVTILLPLDGVMKTAEFFWSMGLDDEQLICWNQHQACRLLQVHGHSHDQDTMRKFGGGDDVVAEARLWGDGWCDCRNSSLSLSSTSAIQTLCFFTFNIPGFWITFNSFSPSTFINSFVCPSSLFYSLSSHNEKRKILLQSCSSNLLICSQKH